MSLYGDVLAEFGRSLGIDGMAWPQSGIVQSANGLATCLYDAEMLVWMTLSGVCGIVEASYYRHCTIALSLSGIQYS